MDQAGRAEDMKARHADRTVQGRQSRTGQGTQEVRQARQGRAGR